MASLGERGSKWLRGFCMAPYTYVGGSPIFELNVEEGDLTITSYMSTEQSKFSNGRLGGSSVIMLETRC